MTLSKGCLNKWSWSLKNSKILGNIAIMVIRRPTPVSFTSKDRVAYQINGKTTISREKKINKKEIWVSRLLLITCSSSKTNILAIFKNKHLHIFKHLTNLKIFSKDQHLCIRSYERESLQSFPKKWPLYKILSKTTQSTISNKSKWSSK